MPYNPLDANSALLLRLATAYILGLLSSTGPRFIKILFFLAKRKLTLQAACVQLWTILRQAQGIHRFPAFCGVLVGGSTLLQVPIKALIIELLRLVHRVPTRSQVKKARILARFVGALFSAFVSFRLINSASFISSSASQIQPFPPPLAHPAHPTHSTTHLDFVKPGPFDEPPEPHTRQLNNATLSAKCLSRTDLAGKSLDLTIFAVIRALDVVISSAWNRPSPSKHPNLKTISRSTPTILFCLSVSTIMHSWFYSPSRLPQTYNNWISAAAQIDQRLMLALRHAQYGSWVYGKDTGMAPLLGSMCRDYGLPEDLGDPEKTIPIPCELVHMGWGKSCEKHALVRFCRGWLFAAKMYAPMQLLVVARHLRRTARPGNKLVGLTQDVLLKALADMARSSAFLGAFISFFYYGVCLSRTRLGPKLFSYKSVTPQMWDSGLCVLAGCLVCGTSILVEQSRKRLEVVFFVLPRAVATWLPRRYLPENRWIEQWAFTISAAVLLTAAQEDPTRVRGVLGSALHSILKTK
ncbi:hypothetical protein K504DRAFT_468791 [Pleomassaria siparia CBS 279.74]|uniref:Integral membrane protein n=1 Tax=Pleomassaria siparia CBS 279.74 TaxID=1314801 RepID=A0A6G1K6K9_9PLEO|nr:hypothetical protein K504DRAFT_468791 [Pleomassaria siparia CBS 279.74]